MGGVYVTQVADDDKGQWHGMTLVWSFKRWRDGNWVLQHENTLLGAYWKHTSVLLTTTIVPPHHNFLLDSLCATSFCLLKWSCCFNRRGSSMLLITSFSGSVPSVEPCIAAQGSVDKNGSPMLIKYSLGKNSMGQKYTNNKYLKLDLSRP